MPESRGASRRGIPGHGKRVPAPVDLVAWNVGQDLEDGVEERASYAAGRKKPTTFRDLQGWLDRLAPDQLDAPALIASSDDELLIVSALFDYDQGADGPVVLAGDPWRTEDLHGEEH